MNVEKLLKLERDPEKDKKTAEGFTQRQKLREEEYERIAREQAPDEEFYNRAYYL